MRWGKEVSGVLRFRWIHTFRDHDAFPAQAKLPLFVHKQRFHSVAAGRFAGVAEPFAGRDFV